MLTSAKESQREQWIEETKAKIKALKKSHNLARYQQDLTIETTHRFIVICISFFVSETTAFFAYRDSRYSFGLMELMRQEEAAILLYQSTPTEANNRQLLQLQKQVDDALRTVKNTSSTTR